MLVHPAPNRARGQEPAEAKAAAKQPRQIDRVETGSAIRGGATVELLTHGGAGSATGAVLVISRSWGAQTHRNREQRGGQSQPLCGAPTVEKFVMESP